MKTTRIVLFVLIGIVAAGFVVTFLTSRSQSQNKSAQTKPGDEIPIVDIYAPEPDDPATKELQRNRGRKYDTGVPIVDFLEPDSDLVKIPTAHAPAEQALPADKSDLIVIGSVTNSQAFLSGDRTYVYSEFTVRIEKTLKNSSPLDLDTGSEIITEREGGKVRFPTGNILHLGTLGRGFPQNGNRYFLFLKWSESGKDFVILTGYKIQNGKVTPLDGNVEDLNLPIYKNYGSLKDEDIKDLTKRVKKAISSREASDK